MTRVMRVREGDAERAAERRTGGGEAGDDTPGLIEKSNDAVHIF